MNSANGKVAELLVASELLRRGFRVAVPIVDDDGVDLIVDYRVCVQVKAFTWDGQVDFRPQQRRLKNRAVRGPKSRWIREHVDIVVLVCRDGGSWLIIPAAELRKTACGSVKTTTLREWKDRWDVFGLPAADIPVYEPDTQAALFDA